MQTPPGGVPRILIAAALGACGGDDGGAAAIDATPGDGAAAFDVCEGACRTTQLTATFGGTTRVLDAAYHGVTTSAAGDTLYLEAYAGAAPGCPSMNSPTPDYTLILGRVGVPTGPQAVTSPASLLDFKGDLLGGSPAPVTATAVTLTAVAYSATAGFVALDVNLTFPTGTITGHLFATRCASLDSAE